MNFASLKASFKRSADSALSFSIVSILDIICFSLSASITSFIIVDPNL